MRKEADRRHDGASSTAALSATGSVDSGDGARPLGGLVSDILRIISGAAGGLSRSTQKYRKKLKNISQNLHLGAYREETSEAQLYEGTSVIASGRLGSRADKTSGITLQ